MNLDDIALAHTNELDRVYPPMVWTARWSTGSNMPIGTPEQQWIVHALHGTTEQQFYKPGLWLVSEEGHMELFSNIGESMDGMTVTAWTYREAEARLMAEIIG